MEYVKVNDVGIDINITILKADKYPLDISTAVEKIIYIKKPNGKVMTKTANFVTDGKDGKVKYTSIVNDFDVVGVYRVQARVVFEPSVYHSSIEQFTVESNLM